MVEVNATLPSLPLSLHALRKRYTVPGAFPWFAPTSKYQWVPLSAKPGLRKTMIVALARKLLIAL